MPKQIAPDSFLPQNELLLSVLSYLATYHLLFYLIIYYDRQFVKRKCVFCLGMFHMILFAYNSPSNFSGVTDSVTPAFDLVFLSIAETVDRQFHAAGILFAAVGVRIIRVGRDGGIRFL